MAARTTTTTKARTASKATKATKAPARKASLPAFSGAMAKVGITGNSKATKATKAPARKAPAKRGTLAKGTSSRHNAAANADMAHTLAQIVRDAREAAGMTKAQLAEAMGTSAGAVARIEDARTNCTVATLANIAQGLGKKLTISFG